MRHFLHRVAIMAVPLLLGACATHPTGPVYTNPVLPAHWEAEGKAAVRGHDHGTNLYFTWTQTGDTYHIVVRGPMGLGRAELNGAPGIVTLTADGQDQDISATSPEELLERTTHHQAPVSHAMHWMKAEPATAHAQIERDAQGRPRQIREDNWTVDYLEWSEEAPLLPRRLTLEGPDGRATVVIGLWRLHIDEAAAPAAATAGSCCSATPSAPSSGPAATCCQASPSTGTRPAPPPRDPATVLPLPPLDSLPEPAL
ncbi:MAG TPA: lipoprotein insertase outer membrane protein LolB [Moraxellaceae bacterium]|nr:lipoprotein insertase outer membrane protein LolB [Moraxellaceae bacterium]